MTEDFQARSQRVGQAFELAVAAYVEAQGFTVEARKATRHDVEIDLIVRTLDGRELWVECKGGYESPSGRNGAQRTDNVLKFSGALWHLDHADPNHPQYVLATSALPTQGRALAWIERLQNEGVIVWEFPAMDCDV